MVSTVFPSPRFKILKEILIILTKDSEHFDFVYFVPKPHLFIHIDEGLLVAKLHGFWQSVGAWTAWSAMMIPSLNWFPNKLRQKACYIHCSSWQYIKTSILYYPLYYPLSSTSQTSTSDIHSWRSGSRHWVAGHHFSFKTSKCPMEIPIEKSGGDDSPIWKVLGWSHGWKMVEAMKNSVTARHCWYFGWRNNVLWIIYVQTTQTNSNDSISRATNDGTWQIMKASTSLRCCIEKLKK